MGWWSEEKNGVELTIGDGPLDTAERMLRRIAREYKRDVGRKPKPEELAETLRSVIWAEQEIIFGDMQWMEVAELSLKLRKAPKKQPRAVGDYCAASIFLMP